MSVICVQKATIEIAFDLLGDSTITYGNSNE